MCSVVVVLVFFPFANEGSFSLFEMILCLDGVAVEADVGVELLALVGEVVVVGPIVPDELTVLVLGVVGAASAELKVVVDRVWVPSVYNWVSIIRARLQYTVTLSQYLAVDIKTLYRLTRGRLRSGSPVCKYSWVFCQYSYACDQDASSCAVTNKRSCGLSG